MVGVNEIFRKAISSTTAHGVQTAIAKKTGLTLNIINKIITGERQGKEDDRRAIAAALGYKYEDFLDLGRHALGLPTNAKGAMVPPSPEVAACLDKARSILEGPKGEALKTVIESMAKK